MADLNGTWVPETDAEMEFIVAVNEAMKAAHDRGVATDAIVAGLTFAAGSAAMHTDDDAPTADTEDPSEQVHECPACGETIHDVQTFMGGTARVKPCGHEMPVENLGDWVKKPGEDHGR